MRSRGSGRFSGPAIPCRPGSLRIREGTAPSEVRSVLRRHARAVRRSRGIGHDGRSAVQVGRVVGTGKSPADARDALMGLRGPGRWRRLGEALGVRRRMFGVIQVEVTTHCHARCRYCPRAATGLADAPRHMDMATFAALRPILLESDRIHLQGWGEPLLHPHFLDLAQLAVRMGCKVSTTTSGTRMPPELAAGIVDSGIDVVAISLAGTTPGGHDRARPGAPFGMALAAAEAIRRARERRGMSHPQVHLAYMLLAGNAAEAA
ncbi:MAG: radical SAM protein, partial [Desulfovibrio sp.]|nr:radical SAM protein [Desulfovibrio sp.]